MVIDIHWHTENPHALICEVSEHWTLDDLKAAIRSICKLAAHRKSWFYCVVDVTSSKTPPSGFLQAIAEISTSCGSDYQGLIVIGANRLYRALLLTAKRVEIPVLSAGVIYADSIAQGLQAIKY